MSRVGNLAINIPDGVDVDIQDKKVRVKGSNGELNQDFGGKITIKKTDKIINVKLDSDAKNSAMQGTARSIISNMIIGVSKGFSKTLEVNGVGYKAQLVGKFLRLSLGYSHDIMFALPDGVSVKIEKNNIIVSGCDKQLIGRVAARIRQLRKPEPYKGKGIRCEGEYVRRKEGKKK